MAVDGSGNLYIADASNHRIRKVDAAGVISTVAGDGTLGYGGDGGTATAAQLQDPNGVALDGAGNLYIADANNNRVRKVNSAGVITTVAGTGAAGYGGDGGPATAAQLNFPRDVDVDREGNLYIADPNNYRVRKVDTAGVITTVAGTGTQGFSGDGGAATAARLNRPTGVALDGAGNLYIADENNHRIRKVGGWGSPRRSGGLALAEVVVEAGGKSSYPRRFWVGPHGPGVFTASGAGSGQAIALFAGTTALAAPSGFGAGSRPARAGEVLEIYATGLGPVDPPLADGMNSCMPAGVCLADGSNVVLRHTTERPRVSIGGVAVAADGVLFSGLAPTLAAVDMVLVEVPAGIEPSAAAEVLIAIGGRESQPGVTVAVE